MSPAVFFFVLFFHSNFSYCPTIRPQTDQEVDAAATHLKDKRKYNESIEMRIENIMYNIKIYTYIICMCVCVCGLVPMARDYHLFILAVCYIYSSFFSFLRRVLLLSRSLKNYYLRAGPHNAILTYG